MPTHIENMGGKTLRYALPVAVTLGTLCFAADSQNQPNSHTEQAQAAAEIHPGPEASGNFGKSVLLLSGLEPLPEGGWKVSFNENFLKLGFGSEAFPAPQNQEAKPVAPATTTYTVEPGDSFSSIAAKLELNKSGWNVFNLIRDNHKNPWDAIYPGEVLETPKPGEAPAAPEPMSPTYELVSYYSPVSNGGQTVHSTSYASASVIACISSTENGGSYDRSSNPTHFGRYQFDRQTWAAFGGNPNDWGYASPAEQDRVFATAMATPGGYLHWTLYDGC